MHLNTYEEHIAYTDPLLHIEIHMHFIIKFLNDIFGFWNYWNVYFSIIINYAKIEESHFRVQSYLKFKCKQKHLAENLDIQTKNGNANYIKYNW